MRVIRYDFIFSKTEMFVFAFKNVAFSSLEHKIFTFLQKDHRFEQNALVYALKVLKKGYREPNILVLNWNLICIKSPGGRL